MDSYLKLLLSNEAWVKETLYQREDFFPKRSQWPEAGVSLEWLRRFARAG